MQGKTPVFPYRVALEPPNTANKAEILKFYAQKRAEQNLDYSALAKEMETQEQATGHAFCISQIRNLLNWTDANKPLTQEALSDIIRKQTPTIDKEHLSKFNDEIKEFIQNKVEA